MTLGFAILSLSASADGIEIRSANSRLADGVHLVSARMQFHLSERIEDALAKGIALQVEIDFRIYRSRRFWLDANVATLTLTSVLRYNTVTERYTLRNLNTEQQTSYATIFAALNAIGRVDDVPLVDDAVLREGARYSGEMRAQVSIADYPLSMKYLLFWREDWRVSSAWFAWPLDH